MEMRLKHRIEQEVRVESADMRCLCETLAICFDELINELQTLRETLESDMDPRRPEFR